jgi:hypothetical protein
MNERRAYGRGLLPRDALGAAVAQSTSIAGVLRVLGVRCDTTGRRQVRRSLDAHKIDTAHFTGQRHFLGSVSPTRKSAEEILVRHPPGAKRVPTTLLRRALDELGEPRICAECAIGDIWQGRRLVLEIDHVNGERWDNRRENLRYLCPSCHSQTSTFASRSPRTTTARDEVG